MVARFKAQAIAPPTTASTSAADPKLELGSSVCQHSTTTTTTASRSSRSSCISVRACLPLYSPAMEATKNLALRLRHRASLRRVGKKTAPSANAAAAEQDRAHAAHHKTDGQQKAGKREGERSRAGASASNIPAAVQATNDPPPPAAAAADTTTPTATASLLTAPESPLTPSPGTDVSPTSQLPSMPSNNDNGASLDNAPAETPTSEYFNLDRPADDTPFNKITFAIPTKAEDAVDGRDQEYESCSPGLETAVSSASPSSLPSPRDSVDDATSIGGGSWFSSRIPPFPSSCLTIFCQQAGPGLPLTRDIGIRRHLSHRGT